jgi:uncharacterized protein YycO
MYIAVEKMIRCMPGQKIDTMEIRPGDFILVKKDSFYHRLVEFGQRLRFPRIYAVWTHAALVVDGWGSLIEAEGNGVISNTISEYTEKDYVYVRIKATAEDRAEVVNYAKSCLGNKYGWGSIVCIGLCLLTGLKISVGFHKTMICSGLVAAALARTETIFPIDDRSITPAALAQWYQT